MEAIVTDVDISTAVAGLRDLGRREIPALAVAPRWTAGGLWSRYATERAVCPGAERDPLGFAEAIDRLASRYGNPIVYPSREEAVGALLDAAGKGSISMRLPYADAGAVQVV